MKRKIAVVALLVLVATGITTASSFTTATLTRDASIDIVADNEGVIGLIDGNSGDVVQVDSTTGELQIDFGGVGTAQGVNVDSVYELGDPADPTTRAFNITNQDGVAHTINLNYTVTGSTTNVVGNNHNATEFQVYDSSGSHVVTVSEEDSGASFSMASGESVAVVVVVDSTHAQIDQNDDLSGIFQVTAT